MDRRETHSTFYQGLPVWKIKGFWELAPADDRIPTAVSKAPFCFHKQSTFQKAQGSFCPLYSLLPASSVSLLLTAYPETSVVNQQIARMYLCSTADLCVYSNFSYWVVGAVYQNIAYKKENVLLGNTQHLALNLIVSSPQQILNGAKQMPFSSLG